MYKFSQSVRTAHGQDGAILLDIRKGQMFNINLVGSRILELLDAGNSESRIAEEISGEFAVSRNVVQPDVEEFIRSLRERKLIEEVK